MKETHVIQIAGMSSSVYWLKNWQQAIRRKLTASAQEKIDSKNLKRELTASSRENSQQSSRVVGVAEKLYET
jgi:hypothetical protein